MKGLGAQLQGHDEAFLKACLELAERIAKEEYDARKILVLWALGVKEYYAKQGYERDGVICQALRATPTFSRLINDDATRRADRQALVAN